MRKKNIGIDRLEYQFDLNPRAETEKNHRDLVINVTFFTSSNIPSHFGIHIEQPYEEDQFLAEELSIEQLERLYDFIGLVLKLSKNKKGT